MFEIQRIDPVAFIVRDVERSVAWYESNLGMERVYEDAWTGRGDPIALCVPGSSCPVCVALFRPGQGESQRPHALETTSRSKSTGPTLSTVRSICGLWGWSSPSGSQGFPFHLPA